jgi:hypothetical protein
MTTYGYAPVSPDGQTLDAQVAALKAAGAERVFSEKNSGAKTDRAAGPGENLKGRHLTPSLRALIAAKSRQSNSGTPKWAFLTCCRWRPTTGQGCPSC